MGTAVHVGRREKKLKRTKDVRVRQLGEAMVVWS